MDCPLTLPLHGVCVREPPPPFGVGVSVSRPLRALGLQSCCLRASMGGSASGNINNVSAKKHIRAISCVYMYI